MGINLIVDTLDIFKMIFGENFITIVLYQS